MKLTERENELIEEYKANRVDFLKRPFIIKKINKAMQEHGYTYNEAIKNLYRIPGIHEPGIPFSIELLGTPEEIEAKVEEVMNGCKCSREEAEEKIEALGMVLDGWFDIYREHLANQKLNGGQKN